VDRGEVFLEGVNITPYEQGNRYNHEPVRARKLLLHKREIQRMIGAVEQQGLTLIPLELYFKRGRAKVALALARGKKHYDKREDAKRRIAEREVARAVRARGRT
jgi:SsrA-binding protein